MVLTSVSSPMLSDISSTVERLLAKTFLLIVKHFVVLNFALDKVVENVVDAHADELTIQIRDFIQQDGG